jgi:hypothetical protein
MRLLFLPLALLLGALAPAAAASPEEVLRAKLGAIRREHLRTDRRAVLGPSARLRDAVAERAAAGAPRPSVPLCADLEDCRQAPLAVHVEDNALLDEAFVAAARPWLKLQEARGKAVSVAVDPGVGVRLRLEDLPSQPVVTLEAQPSAADGGFDVVLVEGPAAARAYARERAALRGE